MVICFDATFEAHNALQRLTASGRYPDSSAAISAAICNLAVLDAAVQRGGGTFVPALANAAVAGPSPAEAMHPSGLRTSDIPQIFSLPKADVNADDFVVSAGSSSSAAIAGPKDWPWGQFNKLLPLKTTVRALFNVLAHDRETPLMDAANRITAASAQLAVFLRRIDKANGYAREDAMASAFPSDTQSKEKSLIRFSEQFVFGAGSFATSSFPFEFGFVAPAIGRENVIRLTGAGASFAVLPNPILDGDAQTAASKFNPEELNFLRQHVLATVPTERAALTAILSGLHAGHNSPDALDNFLRGEFPQQAESLTPAVLTTQRAGAISRAIDLLLVRRRREGVRVFYEVEPAGHDFFHAANSTKI